MYECCDLEEMLFAELNKRDLRKKEEQ